MKFELIKLNIVLDILVNFFLVFFLINAFLNLDLLKTTQSILLSVLIINAYIINKKIIRNKKCHINWKQILVACGIGIANFFFLLALRKLF